MKTLLYWIVAFVEHKHYADMQKQISTNDDSVEKVMDDFASYLKAQGVLANQLLEEEPPERKRR